MNTKKIIIAIVVAVLVAIGLGAIKNTAGATGGDGECIPATPGQHYSWTGGHLPTDQPPTEVPPSDNWQANTSQEPHDNGAGNPATWVNESLHYTANSQGHASWFYYTHPKPESGDCEEEPEVVKPIIPPVLDPCGPDNASWDLSGGSPSNGFTYDLTEDGSLAILAADGYEFPDGSTTWIVGYAPDSGELCPPGEQPDPIVTQESSQSYQCGDDFKTVTTTTTTTEYVLVDGEWVLGMPVVSDPVVTQVPVDVVPCEEPPCPEEPSRPLVVEGCEEQPTEPPIVRVPEQPTKNPPAVPTSVDAGV